MDYWESYGIRRKLKDEIGNFPLQATCVLYKNMKPVHILESVGLTMIISLEESYDIIFFFDGRPILFYVVP